MHASGPGCSETDPADPGVRNGGACVACYCSRPGRPRGPGRAGRSSDESGHYYCFRKASLACGALRWEKGFHNKVFENIRSNDKVRFGQTESNLTCLVCRRTAVVLSVRSVCLTTSISHVSKPASTRRNSFMASFARFKTARAA